MKKGKLILICEDDPGISELTQFVLEAKGYEVCSCSEGNKVFSCVMRFLPDLILLDLWMPGANGPQVAAFLQENEKTAKIPIIVLSANTHVAEIAHSIGAISYLTKPFDIDDLEKIVTKFLPLS